MYGRFLGSRYRQKWNVVWVIGGDRLADENMAIWDAMAKGIRSGCENIHLITYHPRGQESSSFWLHEKPWLSFNMIQTGHLQPGFNVYDWVANDYNLKPEKPVLNGEPVLTRIPDQQLIIGDNPSFATDHIRVTRDGTQGNNDATFIFIYLPYYRNFRVITSVISGERLKIWWYNPRTGEAIPVETIDNTGDYSGSKWSQGIREEQGGPDWVVVIDDADKM